MSNDNERNYNDKSSSSSDESCPNSATTVGITPTSASLINDDTAKNATERQDQTSQTSNREVVRSFVIPQRILKNMTPIKDRSLATKAPMNNLHQLRKQNLLDCKTEKLREQRDLIKERLLEVNRKREKLLRENSRKLTKSLESANERRQEHINDIQTKARLQFEKQEKVGKVLMETFDKYIYVHQESHNQEILPISTTPSLKFIDYRFTTNDFKRIIRIQRYMKYKLFKQNLNNLNDKEALQKLLTTSYDETKRSLKDENSISKSLVSVLSYMKLPDYTPTHKYRSFRFAFILIADMNESIATHSHSGINSNSALDRNLSNSLAIMLYKISYDLINQMITLFKSSSRDILSRISLERLKFGKTWRLYHFVFSCFKSIHLQNCISIATDVLKIIDTQLHLSYSSGIPVRSDSSGNRASTSRITESIEEESIKGIQDTKHFLLINESFLKQKLTRSSEANGSNRLIDKYEWTFIGQLAEEFVNSIENLLKRTLAPRNPIFKASFEALDQKLRNDNLQTLKYIELNSISYFIPPGISVSAWRQYWMNKLKKEYKRQKEEKVLSAPKTIRTGTNREPNAEKHTENVNYEELGIRSIHTKYEKLMKMTDLNKSLLHLEKIVRDAFLSFFEYVWQLQELSVSESESESEFLTFSGFLSDHHDLTSYSTEEYSYDSNESLIMKYFKLHLIVLYGLLKASNMFSVNTISSIDELIQETTENESVPNSETRASESIQCMIQKYSQAYWDLEITLFGSWIKFCKFDNLEKVKNFENTFKFISAKKFSVSMGTNSPQLRFPNFYKFINHQQTLTMLSKYLNIIKASYEIPNLKARPLMHILDKNAFCFFRQNFVNFMIVGVDRSVCEKLMEADLKNNEILDLFEDDFSDIMIKFRSLLVSNLALILIQNFNLLHQLRFNLAIVSKFSNDIYDFLLQNEEEVHNDIESIVKQIVLAYWEYQDSQSQVRASLESYLLKEMRKLNNQPANGSIIEILISKFASIFRTDGNAQSLDSERDLVIKTNFRFFDKQVMEITRGMIETIDLIYQIYNPLLNWIYMDIGGQ